MVKSSLSNCMSIINQHIALQGVISDHLLQAEALFKVLLCGNFDGHPKKVVYEYLRVLSDIVCATIDDHEKLLKLLIFKAAKLHDPCTSSEGGETMH